MLDIGAILSFSTYLHAKNISAQIHSYTHVCVYTNRLIHVSLSLCIYIYIFIYICHAGVVFDNVSIVFKQNWLCAIC